MDKSGYLSWRTQLYHFHAETAGAIMASSGYDKVTISCVKSIVSKKNLKSDVETQLMEDIVALVFLEHYLLAFVAQHPEYDEDKWLRILRKTWKKMSSHAHEFARSDNINLPIKLVPIILKAIQ
jgi:hypothetical protein